MFSGVFPSFLKKRAILLDRDYKISRELQNNETIKFVTINGTIGLQRALNGLKTYFFGDVWFKDYFNGLIQKVPINGEANAKLDNTECDIDEMAKESLKSNLDLEINVGMNSSVIRKKSSRDATLLREYLLRT